MFNKDLGKLQEEYTRLTVQAGTKAYQIQLFQKELKEIYHKMEKLARSSYHAAVKQEKKKKLEIVTTGETANETL